MSSLEQLTISGVRSFDPNPTNEQVLSFHKPLTVILGRNGAGKTTIIESLLYSCTAAFPPGATAPSDRQSFVFDPRSGDEVKGKITLKAVGSDKKEFKVYRTFEAKTKGGKRSFHGLDHTLVFRGNDGAIHQRSLQEGELSENVATRLGVSPAVLEHVVFCHQEDFNWPLGNDKDVKERLDELFQSTRYAEALDALRKKKNEMKEEQKENSANVLLWEERKQEAKKLKEELAELKREKLQAEGSNKGLGPQADELRSVQQQLDTIINDVAGISRKQALLQGKIEEKERRLASMKKPQIHQSLEVLEENCKNYKSHMAELQADTERKRNQRLADEDALQKLQTRKATLDVELLHLQKIDAELKSKVAQLQATVRSGTSEFVAGNAEFDPKNLQSEQTAARENAKSRRTELENFNKTAEQKLEELRVKHGELKIKLATDKMEHDMGKKQAEKLKRQVDELQEKLNAVGVNCTPEHLAVAELAKAEASKALKQAVEARQRGSVHQEISAAWAKLQCLTEKLSELRQEMNNRDEESKQVSRKQWIQSTMAEKERELERTKVALIEALRQKLIATEGSSLNSVASSVQNLVQRKAHALADLEGELKTLEQRKGTLFQLLKEKKEELETEERKCQVARAQCVSALGEKFSPETYKAALEKAETSQERLQKQLAALDSMSKCYQSFVFAAKKDRLCVVCQRGLTDEALADFVALNQQKQSTTPKEMAETEKQLEEVKAEIRRLRVLNQTVLTYERLSLIVLPNLKSVCTALSSEIAEHEQLLNSNSTKRQNLVVQHNEAEKLAEQVKNCRDLEASISDITEEIAVIEAKLAKPSTAGSRSMEEIQGDYQQCVVELEATRKKVDALRKGADNEAMGSLESNLRKYEENWRNLHSQLEKKSRLEEEIGRTSQEMIELASLLKEIESRRSKNQAEIDDLETKIDEAKRKADQQRLRLGAEAKQAADDAAKLDAVAKEVKQLLESDTLKRLPQIQEEARQAATEHRRQAEACEQLKKEIHRNEKQLDEQDRHFKDIQEFVEAARLRRGIEADKAECAQLAERHKELVLLRSEPVRKFFDFDPSEEMEIIQRKIAQKLSEHESSIARNRGRLDALDAQIKQKGGRLEEENLRDADARYASYFIKMQTAKVAVEDLDKFYSILDAAITSYHREKVEEVNRIIDELWSTTYKGSDVDQIRLVADVESTQQRRNYRYRVVMRRGNSEMDMRGRCSAGQKVLASVIIRLALSYAFCCSSCGILALDEPTTNLDDNNALALANSLRNLIEEKQKSDSFQLIVITHDEKFARTLGHGRVDNYYFIDKNASGYSVISERNFSDLS